jgi:hypothetical protein
MTRPIDVGQIAQMLAARVHDLVAELLPGGRREGHEWRTGSLAGEAGQSCGVHLTGARAGVWSDFATGERGDALDLVAQVLFRGDKAQAIRWSRSWLGLDNADPARLAQLRRQAAQREARASDDERRRRDYAFRVWLSARESIEGTAAQTYLEGRGIDFGYLGRIPRGLRFYGALPYHDRVDGREVTSHWPAMVAAIQGPGGSFAAVHRTYLSPRTDGSVGKAPTPDAKRTLGRFAGGAIHVWRPMLDGRPACPIGEAKHPRVFITEGIENALSVAMDDIGRESYVLAAVSLGNMARLQLPVRAGELTLVADNDLDNAGAAAQLERACEHLADQADAFYLARPDERFKDVNDALRGIERARPQMQDGAA